MAKALVGYSRGVQLLCCVWLFATPWTAGPQVSLSFTISQSLLKLMSIELVMPSNHLILCHPLLFLPSIFPSIRVFSNESVLLIRWPKYWSFSFNISPSNVYSGLISFRMDWLDLLAVQETLKSLLQCHSSKAKWSIPKSDWLYSLKPKMEKLYTVSKTRLGADCGSDHELLIAKFRLKLKKVGKTTRPFKNDIID